MENDTSKETNSQVNTKIDNQLWKKPWAYKEGFFIAFVILVAGFLIEIITGGGSVQMMRFPVNLIILLAFANLIVLNYLAFKDFYVIRWLATIPAAIGSMALLLFLVLLMGFIKQNDTNAHSIIKLLALNHITTSFPFLFAQIYLFVTLGFVTVRRSIPFTIKNIGFLLNHAGLWITLAAAAMGAGDLKSLKMDLSEGQNFSNLAYSIDGQLYKLPFSLKLNQFLVEEYNPKLVLIKNNEELILEGGKTLSEIGNGFKTNLSGWNVSVEKFYKNAVLKDSIYQPDEVIGSMPAAYVTIRKDSKTISGWLTCGSFVYQRKLIKLNETYSLAMTSPETKMYRSKLEYITSEKKRDSVILDANKPIHLEGWKVYQLTFDSKKDRWNTIHSIEFVSDPWQPVVYFGIFMLIAGALYIFWQGRKL